MSTTLEVVASRALLRSATFAAACAAFGQELNVFTDDAEFGSFLPGLLVFPSVELESSFNKNAAAFGEVVGCDFCLTVPEGYVNEGCFFLSVGVFSTTGNIAVDGESDVRDGRAFGGVADFGVGCQVPHQEYFIEIGHKRCRVFSESKIPPQGRAVILSLYRSFDVWMQSNFLFFVEWRVSLLRMC